MTKSKSLISAREAIVKVLASAFDFDEARRYEKVIYRAVCDHHCEADEEKEGVDVATIYKRVAYEKVGQIMACKDEERVDEIVEDIKCGAISWSSCVYTAQKEAYERAINKSIQKPTAIKGTYVCQPPKGCGSDEFYIWKLQVRGGDEGTTTYRECSVCGRRGKED